MQTGEVVVADRERRSDRVEQALSALEQAVRGAREVDISWIGKPLAEDGWELAPDVLRLLSALVAALRPRHVLEFGSGVSTLVLARAAAQLGDCAVTSVDHDPKFAVATEAMLGAEGTSIVSLQCAPVVARVRAGRLQPCYLVDPAGIAALSPADLILVDGPPEVLGGRAGMLYQALEYAQSGTIVLLDDADRAGERAALAEWSQTLGDAIRIQAPGGFVRGLAAVILAAPTVARIRMGGR
jgi:predicted O-methyltransferase YrrM